MENVELKNGMLMPIVGFGTWQSTDDILEQALEVALHEGYRHIDTAYLYCNEGAIGRVLKRWLDSGRVKRGFICSDKASNDWIPEGKVEKYLKRSLEDLQLSYVDLYLLHQAWGMRERGEDRLPMDKTGELLLDYSTDHISLWRAMEEQVDAGRARAIGLSNFNSRQIKRIVKYARIKPACLQIEVYLYFQQRELVAFCNALDIAVCAYGPLGSPSMIQAFSGMGGDTDKIPRVNPMNEPTVLEIARKHSRTAAQVLLRHTVQRGIAVIPKSCNTTRIKENFKIMDFFLDEEDIEKLDALDRGRKYRLFSSNINKGMDKHPEYAFNEPY